MQNQSEKRDVVSDKSNSATLKKRYTSPRLSHYGSVRTITHGNGSSPLPDGHSGRSRKDKKKESPS